MLASATNTLQLHCHPDTACPVLACLHVVFSGNAQDGLQLRYSLNADLTELRIPAATTPAAADGLWQHSCFEAFIGTVGDAAYREFNFSPSGEWAAYAFGDYRARLPWSPEAAPSIAVEHDADGLVLTASLSPALLPSTGGALQLGLSAVLEAVDGGLSYWALQHPPGQPDFHRRDCFVAHWPL